MRLRNIDLHSKSTLLLKGCFCLIRLLRYDWWEKHFGRENSFCCIITIQYLAFSTLNVADVNFQFGSSKYSLHPVSLQHPRRFFIYALISHIHTICIQVCGHCCINKHWLLPQLMLNLTPFSILCNIYAKINSSWSNIKMWDRSFAFPLMLQICNWNERMSSTDVFCGTDAFFSLEKLVDASLFILH